jgi:rhodanese-related sulfurtransferase
MAQLIEFTLRHPLLIGATLLALLAAIVNELRLRGQSGVSVAPPEAVRLINQGATVVDLREQTRFDTGHIVDAINLAPGELAEKPDARIRKKKPVLLVCETGSSSARLVNTLRQAGFENTWSLDGGVSAWQRDNLPLVATRAKG